MAQTAGCRRAEHSICTFAQASVLFLLLAYSRSSFTLEILENHFVLERGLGRGLRTSPRDKEQGICSKTTSLVIWASIRLVTTSTAS